MDKEYTHKRKCNRCGVVKPISDFAARNRHTNRHDTTCKECRNELYRDKYRSNRKSSNLHEELTIVTPVICPCGAVITEPTNGVWLCPNCAPKQENKIVARNVAGVTMRMYSNCWSCKYMMICQDRIADKLPILCEVELEKERIPLPAHSIFSSTTSIGVT